MLQPPFVGALNAGFAAAGALTGTLAQLSTAIKNDEEYGKILQAGAQLVQQTRIPDRRLPAIGVTLKVASRRPCRT